MNLEKVEGGFRPTTDGKAASSLNGMVATAFPQATRAGVDMLNRGGNAVDAACAAAFALSVCEPQASGLGGQTMAMIHLDGRTIALDGSSRVPSLAHLSKIKSHERILGYQAATVPSTPATLGYLHLRYGRLEWPVILEPAIRLAWEGYGVSKLQHDLQQREMDLFNRVESRSGAKAFLREGRKPFREGDIFRQPQLARVLEILAQQGPRGFYLGPLAERIGRDMEANNGFLRADDLALIPWPVERKPIIRNYRDVSVATIPPPAAGRSLLLVLMMLETVPSQFLAEETPRSFHFLAEAFRKAFLQRRQHPMDPNLYAQAPDRTMTNPQFARTLAQSITDRVDPSLSREEPRPEGGETTHISVMDDQGNAVALSQSIESIYGSKAAAEGLGFMYNNYLNTLETKDPSHPHYLRPNALPWSSVAPAIMFYNGLPWLAVGSPGSDRIYSTIAQFLSHMVDGGMSIYEAMRQPRLHCSLGGVISLEADRFDPALVGRLEELGYRIDRRKSLSFYLGAINAVLGCQTRPGFQGVSEFRRDGSAAGPE